MREQRDQRWPQAKANKLRRLIEKRLTRGQIAEKMGITRNAVIGKASRMGFRVYETIEEAAIATEIKIIRKPSLPLVKCIAGMQFETFVMVPFVLKEEDEVDRDAN